MPTTQITIRVDAEKLAAIEKVGQGVTPKPLNRSEIINVAIAEYIERHRREADRPKRGGGRG